MNAEWYSILESKRSSSANGRPSTTHAPPPTTASAGAGDEPRRTGAALRALLLAATRLLAYVGGGDGTTGRSEPDRVGLRGVPAATATVLHTGAVRRTHISPVHLRDGAPTLEERSLSAVALGPAADCNSQHLCSPAACPRTHASGPALPVGPAPPCQQVCVAAHV